MRQDIINGYEYVIFEERELAQAEEAENLGHPRVRIQTRCSVCGWGIQASATAFKNRHVVPVAHSENYHKDLK